MYSYRVLFFVTDVTTTIIKLPPKVRRKVGNGANGYEYKPKMSITDRSEGDKWVLTVRHNSAK